MLRLLLLAAMAFAGFAAAALAQQGTPPRQPQGFRVCNASQATVDVAKAIYAGTTDGRDRVIISEGWWKVRPSTCALLWSGPLTRRHYMLYAHSPENKREWTGKIPICVNDHAFTIRSDVCGPERQRRFFFELDTGDEKNLATFTFN